MQSQLDPLERLNPRVQRWACRVRDAWRTTKDFGDVLWTAIKDFGDALGFAGALGLLALQELHGLVRNCAPWMLAAALLGTSSPATGGLGVSWLQESPLMTWAPIGVMPVVVVLIRLTISSLAALLGETKREARRQKRERKRSDRHEILAGAKTARVELNSPYELDETLPNLDDLDFTYGIVAGLARLIRGQYGVADAGLALMREREDEGFLADICKNIDDRVKDRLEPGPVDRSKIDKALSVRLRPLQYRHAAVEFGAGPRHYLLVVVSGATIPDDVHAEIADQARFLVEEYVWTMRKLEQRRKANEAGSN